jgi:hypothetical protein
MINYYLVMGTNGGNPEMCYDRIGPSDRIWNFPFGHNGASTYYDDIGYSLTIL